MENIVKLSSLKEKQKAVIYKLELKQEKICRRLIELGFVKNEKIEVVKNLRKGKTMLIAIRGFILSIDYFIAEGILIWQR